MAYDVFQSRGPTIPISLFGDAASQGIAAGNAQKTKTQSIIEGALKGLQQGEALAQGAQQIVMNQNTIEQLPAQNQMRQEQLEAQTLQNDIQALENKVITDNQDLYLRSKKAELEQKAQLAEQNVDALKTRDIIGGLLQSNDPAEKLKIIEDPRFRNSLINDPKFAEGVLGQLYPIMSPEQRKNAGAMLDFSKQREYDQAQERTNAIANQKFLQQKDKIEQDFLTSPTFQYLTKDIADLSEVKNRIKIFPVGVKTVSNGVMITDEDTPDKSPSSLPADMGKFTVFKDGKEVMTITEANAKPYLSLIKSQEVYDGWLRKQTGAPSRGSSSQSQPAPQGTPNIPTLGSPSTELPPLERAGNQAIVEQGLEEFNSLSQRRERGIAQGTVEERLRTQREEVRQKVNARLGNRAPQGASRLGQIGASQGGTAPQPIVPPVPTITRSTETPAAASPSGAIPTPIVPPTPNAALSNAVKAPVSLRLDATPTVSPDTYARITSDPLTANETALFKGVAAVESRGKRDAVSPTGVRGLFQVTKDTAADYGLNRDIPEENVLAGKLYLTDQLLKFKGDLRLSLAAYNAGPGTVSDAIRAMGSTDWDKVKFYLKETLSPQKYAEVIAYPDKVISAGTQFMGQGGDGDASFLGLLELNNLIKPNEQAEA